MKIRVYFAHSKLDYGSLREKRALVLIRQIWPQADLICPHHNLGECARGMLAYLAVVGWADLVVVMEHRGLVGRGVYEEIRLALNRGIPVQAIMRRRGPRVQQVLAARIVNSKNWIDSYAELVTEL